ncbi:hypothetical protein JTB14_002649 [Gonioctena quinquepunctata]|nr:hypothetical protein JTB14_002649 [Gonioctena quinquepunctata]
MLTSQLRRSLETRNHSPPRQLLASAEILLKNNSAQLAASSRIDQRASCVGLEGAGRTGKKPPPLLRSRTLPAIVVPGVNILQAQLGNYPQDVPNATLPSRTNLSCFQTGRVSFSRDDSAALDMRRKSAVSRLCGTGSYGPERGTDGTLLLRVPAPHVVAARAYRISSAGSSTTALFRIGKLLNQGGSKSQMVVDDSNVTRRLSWERWRFQYGRIYLFSK